MKHDMTARQAAAKIAADLLATEVENGFDGHRLMESFLGDAEFFAAVIREGETLVHQLEAIADTSPKYPDGIDGKDIDQGALGLFGLDWILDRWAQVLWDGTTGYAGRRGQVIAYSQGRDGRYAAQVRLDSVPVIPTDVWFGLDQLRVMPFTNLFSSPPALPSDAGDPGIPDLDHPCDPAAAAPSSTEPPYAFGIRGQYLMGVITEPTWLIGRLVEIDPPSPDRGSAVRGLKGAVDKIGGGQGTWRVHIVGPDTRRWIGLQDVTVMPVGAPEPPAAFDEAQQPMYLWPEGEAPQVRDGEELQILSGEMFAAAPGQMAFRVTSWRIVPADRPTTKAAAE